MGWEEVPNTKVLNLRNIWAGWYPGKNFNDIPGKLGDDTPIGSPDCNNVVWLDGGLKKLFGFNNVNTAALNGGATVESIFYSPVLSEWVGTAGNKAYSDLDAAAPTDITGAVTITANNQVCWGEWQFTTTKFVIGTNGVDVPWKWTGSGNCSALGGSPPTGRWGLSFQNSYWIANTAAQPSTVAFSNLGDAEVWTANDDYKFDAPITGMATLGDKLVVFMQDHIGVLQGTNNRLLTKVDRFVQNVGCSGGHTISKAKINGRDVLVFHSGDGFYVFDGTSRVVKVSHPIQNKYTGTSSVEKWAFSRLSKFWGTYSDILGWYICGMASGADTTNAFGLILDCNRPYVIEDGDVVPHWPLDGIKAINCIATQPGTDVGSSILFGSTDGFIYRFSTTLFNRDGSAYTAYWRSKIFDLINNTIVQEVNVLGDIQTSASVVDFFVSGEFGTDAGIQGSADFSDVGDRLNVDFFVGSSVLAGNSAAFKNFPTGNHGRFLSFKVMNDDLDAPMVINSINLVMTDVSVDSNVGN